MPIASFPLKQRRAIQKWLRLQGFNLNYGRSVKSDEVDFDERCVNIRCQAQPTITALHECGHVLIHLSRKRKPKAKIAGSSKKQFDQNPYYEVSHIHNLGEGIRVVHEEIVAWERGYELGRRLRLGITAKAYQRHVTLNVMTYVRWLAYTPSH